MSLQIITVYKNQWGRDTYFSLQWYYSQTREKHWRKKIV